MSDPRINRFLVAMSKEEKKIIEKAAKKEGISKNEFFISSAALNNASLYFLEIYRDSTSARLSLWSQSPD